ncbi:MAG TPA: adenosylcobinamide-GDP ribazoletransferase [Acidimicrobiales bacterium]|nr:adenosylcobinamide-GDP ribazoletransferase [Acidimicrobiales bacterium]
MRAALSFLTPFGGHREPSPAALPWFPVIGALLGFALGGLWWVSSQFWPPAMAAAVVVIADLAITGLLHMDGLVDSADSLLPHLTPARRLEVMAEPSAGAFGVAAAVGVLLLRFAALASLPDSALLLAGLWCGSRTLMAVIMTRVPYARLEGGLASAFMGTRVRPVAIEGVLSAVVLGALWRPVHGPIAVVGGLAAGWAVVWLARRRIGGFTGDVLGAAGVVAETVGLVLAVGRW